jgi:hypothetical protein
MPRQETTWYLLGDWKCYMLHVKETEYMDSTLWSYSADRIPQTFIKVPIFLFFSIFFHVFLIKELPNVQDSIYYNFISISF